MKDKILVVAVHPDDETLGCGGTLLKHNSQGDEIYWLIGTEVSDENSYYLQRAKEIERVAQLYGFNEVFKLLLNTMQVDEYTMSDLIGRVSSVLNQVQPSIVYLPFKSDVHSDHRKLFEAVYSCTKIFRYPFIKKIYMMETLSETEFAPSTKEDSFIPNVFIDISPYLDKKLEIMRVYQSEVGEHPFPRSERSLKALATLRGATAGCEYAESFMLLKEIG